MEAKELYKNVCDFVERWKDNIPDVNDPKSLDFLSDFAVCVGAEWNVIMKSKEQPNDQR